MLHSCCLIGITIQQSYARPNAATPAPNTSVPQNISEHRMLPIYCYQLPEMTVGGCSCS